MLISMKCRLIYPSIVCCLAVALVACSPAAEQPAVVEKDTTEADSKAIGGVREAWVDAENDSDLDSVTV